MSQSDSRKRRRECKRAGYHLAPKTDGEGNRLCAHCGATL